MAKNSNLHNAKLKKADEFYTRLEDISKEMYHYRHHFQGKSVFLNCDDPTTSNFWRYFELNFDDLGLKRLTSTHYDPEERTYKLVMEAGPDGTPTIIQTPLEGNGDFRSAECMELMDQADIITTNPPFSLFREYLAQLMEHDKQFLILANQNAITYKEVFPLLKDNKVWLGFNHGSMSFVVPDTYERGNVVVRDDGLRYATFGNICWFTNLDIDKRHQPITLWRDYSPEDYPHYDNYDAVEVNRVDNIPCDYLGLMGVPITFMTRYCPHQFRILMLANGNARTNVDEQTLQYVRYELNDQDKGGLGVINGKRVYARILIQRIDQAEGQR